MTLDAEPLAEPTPPRRRWRRFSLRSFLVFITLVACFFGWVARKRRQSEFERQVGKKLEGQGVSVSYHGPYDSLELDLQQKPQGWWRDLAREVLGERIGKLFYRRLPVSDLTPLAGLEKLEELHLQSPFITDLTPLAELEKLEKLRLPGDSISDEEINSLKKALPNCGITRQ